ncbi:MAG: hypothetical protein CMF46_01655 [Legionellales bacterium]|nr:hypothetical protein [Legionellales bacterium]
MQRTRQSQLLFFSLMTGLTSGFPYLLTSDTLKIWMSLSNISLVYVGLASLINLPYTLRFLWAPVIDSIGSYRKAYGIVSIFLCAFTLFTLSLCQIDKQPLLSALTASFTAFFGASSSVALESQWLLSMTTDERQACIGMNNFGFRLSLIITGALSIVLADWISWKVTYQVMSALMILQGMYFIYCPIALDQQSHQPIQHCMSNLLSLINRLINQKQTLLFIISYKITDGFVLNMLSIFMLKALHISPTNIAIIHKVVGLSMSLCGAFFATWYIKRYQLTHSLKVFALFQSGTIILLACIAYYPPDNLAYVVVIIATETFSNGCLSIAIMSYVLNLINPEYAATEYALYTTLSSLSRYIIGPFTGILITYTSWSQYFVCASLIGLTSVWLLTQAQQADREIGLTNSPD